MNYYYLTNIKNNFISNYGEISYSTLMEKKSSFLCYIFNISNEIEAKEAINKIKNNYKDARHVVYIYSYIDNGNNVTRFDDDGEPQGTGTKAIYDMLDKEKITNICIVIVRYFGGILLGAGPLSRTYLNVAKEGFNNCSKKELYNYISKKFEFEYKFYDIIKNRIDNFINEEIIKVIREDFGDKIFLTLNIADIKIEEIETMIYDIIK